MTNTDKTVLFLWVTNSARSQGPRAQEFHASVRASALVEIYARRAPHEFADKPLNLEPTALA